MRLISTSLTATALLILGGCSGTPSPRVVSADALGITYRVAPDRQSEAEEAARDYCEGRGRSAQLRSVTPAENDRSRMSFACV